MHHPDAGPVAGPDVDPDMPALILAGAGLANGLLALRLLHTRPDVPFIVIESGASLGAAHTWSFFESDLTAEQHRWVAPLVAHRWPGYSVRFPTFSRQLATGYLSVSGEGFDAVLRERLGKRLVAGHIASLTPTAVTLSDGRRFAGRAVIDGRGAAAGAPLDVGYQKFIGQVLRLARPHGLTLPIIMDATVDQLDGYRFVYVLPYGTHEVLVEDTRYADGAALDPQSLRDAIGAYALAQGWQVEAVLHEEQGVLPVALGGDIEKFWRDQAVASVGLRAALFHPTTGYSLPDAVRLAELIAAQRLFEPAALRELVKRRSVDTWRRRGFYRLLNRMLFRAARPGKRYAVLQRFYQLRLPLIERFYAANSTWFDQARVLVGKPPVPFGAALRCIPERKHA